MRTHPEFVFEPEPYSVLVEDYGEEFSSEPTVDDFYRQLEFNVERLRFHKDDGMVIYERCPVDFLAYILALKDLNREEIDSAFVEQIVARVLDATQHLDLIVFLPLDEANKHELPDAEEPRLQRAVDSLLVDIFCGDEFGIVRAGGVAVLKASGPTLQRLRVLEDAGGL